MNRHDLNDTRLFWKLSARPGGLHSHDARKLGVSGNPSQRSKDCADRTPMWKVRAPRNGRNGTRYFAQGYQPSDAEPVKPNGADTSSPELGVVPKEKVVLAHYWSRKTGWVQTENWRAFHASVSERRAA